MADPISLAASIVGLVGAATKIAELVAPAAASLGAAASIAATLRSEILNVRTILGMCQALLNDLSSVKPRRAAMVQIDDLVATFMDGVFIFSELESIVADLGLQPDDGGPATGSNLSLVTKAKWAASEKDLNTLLVRLQSFKDSLTCLLAIFNSISDAEAAQSEQRLSIRLTELLESNMEMLRRLNTLEDYFKALPSFQSQAQQRLSTRSTLTSPHLPGEISTAAGPSSTAATGPEQFEKELEASRVYGNARGTECDVSFRSSVARPMAWSIFSGMSLSNISVVSVIALPVFVSEVSNGTQYYGHFVTSTASDAPKSTPGQNITWRGPFSYRHTVKLGGEHTKQTILHFQAMLGGSGTNLVDFSVTPRTTTSHNRLNMLVRLSDAQLSELLQDVMDELDRRNNADAGCAVPETLPIDLNIHPKRNQARAKLGIFNATQFSKLVTDSYDTLVGRYPKSLSNEDA